MSNMNMDETYTANAMANEAENVTVETKAAEVQNNENEGDDWRKVVIGGVTGIVLGAGGAYAAERMTIPTANENGNEENAVKTEESATATETKTSTDEPAKITFKGTAPMAHNVNDEMSFSEAFAAARAEVGPGGVFEWHGQLYGTYYATEWDHMSKEEKDAYRASVTGSHHHHNKPTETPATDTAVAEAKPETAEDANVIVDEPAKPTTTEHAAAAQEPEVEVTLLGHQTITNPDGTISEVGNVVINGHDALVVDIDMDGNYDIIGVDTNGDGQYNQTAPLYPGELTSDDFDANSMQNATDNMYANLPDYVNDADPSSFS